MRKSTASVYNYGTVANAGQDNENSENEFNGGFGMDIFELTADMLYGTISASFEISFREFKDELMIPEDDNLPRPGISCETLMSITVYLETHS